MLFSHFITGNLKRRLRETEQKCPQKEIVFYRLQDASSENRKQKKGEAVLPLHRLLVELYGRQTE